MTCLPSWRCWLRRTRRPPIKRRHVTGADWPATPGHDFYVAEHEGTIRGMVLVSYVRGLRHPGWQAILDVVVPLPAACAIGQELLDFAKARARKRGCQHMVVWVTDHAEDERLAPLAQAGFHRAGEVLSCGLL
ncbi:MAG: GNAT family N-acetyltransferase [Deltaproteobacteria bacterium]|nr:GNAT family N-acetyltransferase [Deltaproteobacteria bacterium]